MLPQRIEPVLHHQGGSRLLHLNLQWPELLHRSPEVLFSIILPRATLPNGRILHRGCETLHHQGTEVLHHYVCCASLLHRCLQVLHCSQFLHRGSKYYTTKTVEYYTEAPKNYSAPSYIIKTEAAKYYVASTSYTIAVSSYFVEPKYFTEARITTTYATLSYYTESPKSYSAPSNYTNY
jgi:hypothetical protein